MCLTKAADLSIHALEIQRMYPQPGSALYSNRLSLTFKAVRWPKSFGRSGGLAPCNFC